MPELPEVETVCRGLMENIQGLKITKTEIFVRKLRDLIPDDLSLKASGTRIVEIKRKAKYILIYLEPVQKRGTEAESKSKFTSKKQTLIIHLGMSGRLTIQEQPYSRRKHDHVIFYLSDKRLLVLNDPRRFGLLSISETDRLLEHKLFRKLGLEPLSKEFTLDELRKILTKKQKNIKQTIMDSSSIVGIGNIYASEALFRSRINPERMASNLSSSEAKSLHQQIIITLEDAIKAGGSTLKDFTKANGESGYFQYQFKVYAREGQPCCICAKPVRKINQGGRSTFFCEECQS